jgi:hypothetical protein
VLAGFIVIVLGTAVLLVGLGLYAGNRSGQLPTFPFAGTITLVAGAALIGGGAVLAGRRSRTGVGILLGLTGIGLSVSGYFTGLDALPVLLNLIGPLIAGVGLMLVADAVGWWEWLPE